MKGKKKSKGTWMEFLTGIGFFGLGIIFSTFLGIEDLLVKGAVGVAFMLGGIQIYERLIKE